MLTVEIKDFSKASDGEAEIEIYCDQEGLEELVKQINFLQNGETHVHLKSNSWAGAELSENRQGEGNILVHHLLVVVKNSVD